MNDTAPKSSVTIKKYANRRLYNTATSSYVTLENLSAMVKEGTEFNVYDAKTGEDLTRSVLTQIIVEEEGKSGQNLLPISFLRQLIGFYGDNMQWMVPKYLDQSMQALTKNQDQLRGYFQNSLGTLFPFGTTLDEMSKQNISMFERAMGLFSPFAAMQQHAAKEAAATAASTTTPCCSTTSKTDSCCTSSPTTSCSTSSTDTTTSTPVTETPTNINDYRQPAAAPTATRLPTNDSPEEMQQKISNLQKQLAELAKKRG